MAASEFQLLELQNLFREINETTDKLLIEKSSVDFLKPYLVLDKKIEEFIPKNIPERFIGFDTSEIF